MLTSTFKVFKTNRGIYQKFLEGYTLEQLNTIPEGFKNNLLWNIAHVIIVQQSLVYKLSGTPTYVPDALIQKYTKGTKPDGKATQEEVDELKRLVISLGIKMEEDYKAGKFKQLKEFTTSTGFTLTTVEDAITFNTYHEGIHLGIMLGLKKFV
ncbi:DinB family protein [Flammeovirga pectinis]|uniref:DinB family protein n=1 Tax=Flammeovirga pectinis TaxID=2494373 RepID=A0A3Q9FNM3_9BACT|nr:DinB family protein [Flammeovirga pectinis]AZQ64294.1 DinB family protein [Flammeovirga pectinis]